MGFEDSDAVAENEECQKGTMTAPVHFFTLRPGLSLLQSPEPGPGASIQKGQC